MSLFHHTSLAFAPIDPLADGLGDDIAVEQSEQERFELDEQLDMTLADKWGAILEDAEKDPEFTFVNED